MSSNGLDEFGMLSEEGSLQDFLPPLEGESARAKEDDVDDMLDVIAREVNDNVFGSLETSRRGSIDENLNLDLDPISIEEISCSLQESMAKFDDFLERANASGVGAEETEDKLTELKPFESSREKRGRECGLLSPSPLLGSTGSAMSPRIRALSGEKLSSMPTLHHGYATTSSLGNKATSHRTGPLPQKNQAWDVPEPVLGEVTGNKMRRLLSDKSYFQSRPAPPVLGPTETSQNAAWDTQTKPSSSSTTRTAMQSLLQGGNSYVASQTSTQAKATVAQSHQNSSPWTRPNPSFPGISLEQMQNLANAGATPQVATTSMQSGFKDVGAVQDPGIRVPMATPPSVASVSIQEMQRRAAGASGVSFPQGTQPSPAESASQSAGMPPPNPAFASVSLQDMQRLATSGVSMPTQTQTAASQGAPWSTSKPAFAIVSMQDMQRLAGNGLSFPTQSAAPSSGNVAQNAGQPPSAPWSSQPHPFASVPLHDMQRLANTGVSIPGQMQTQATPSVPSSIPAPPWAAAPVPSFRTVTMEDMQRLASSGVGPSQSPISSQGNGGHGMPQNSMAQATPKPIFATVHVSLEDMQRLASTGVSMPNLAAQSAPTQDSNGPTQNARWSTPTPCTTAAATLQNVQQPTNITAHIASSQAAAHPVERSVASPPARKPTFASVTIEDMQRLVNAYGSATAQPTPVKSSADDRDASSTGSKPASSTTVVVSLEEMQHLANGGSTDSGSQGHSSESENGTQNKMWQYASTGTREEDNAAAAKNEHVISTDSSTPAKKVSGGAMQRMLSEASYFRSQSVEDSEYGGMSNATWAKPNDNRQPTRSDSHGSVTPEEGSSQQVGSEPDEMLKTLKSLMSRSSSTQRALQEFDKARGLPRSHSQTMVNSSRSRKQIIENKIIAKWDGSPLISDEIELGKPKARVPSSKKRSSGAGAGGAEEGESMSSAVTSV